MRSWLPIVLAAALLNGCSGSRALEPITPSPQIANAVAGTDSRLIWGLWDINICSDHRTVEVVPARSIEMHLNVVRLIEVTPCKTCLTIGNVKLIEPNVLEADLTLIHPYPGLIKYTGFDVRGIFISQGNFTFPVSGRNIAYGTGVPMVLNADGYTPLFNPIEFPETQPGPAALRYIPGKHATGGDLTATLNPFISFRRDAPRRMFEAGGSETRTVRLYAPTGPIHFGYAVDACWQSVENVIDPLTDFPPDANCLEAYRIDLVVDSKLQPQSGSAVQIGITVYDHQVQETISSVAIESPDLFSGELPLSFFMEAGDDAWQFIGSLPNELGAGTGEYPLLVRVTDTESDQNLGQIEAWQVRSVEVGSKNGWARTWGGIGLDSGYSVAADASGNAYVTGLFEDSVDFDPGSGVDIHTSNGNHDVFLSKFDPDGDFVWARTWGGTGWDWGYSVATDASGNVYVTGQFRGTVDFDPGSGVDNHTSIENYDDAFLSKFDSDGDLVWARTWGGFDDDWGSSVATDASGNVYVSGTSRGTVDFDPGSGVDNHTSHGISDAFLSRFDSDGNFIWAGTWGEIVYVGGGPSVTTDASGNTYVSGHFYDTVDFDPGAGVENLTSNGLNDVFLSKFESDGDLAWAITWGGADGDDALSVATDAWGNVYVAGLFYGTADFDPGSGVDNHTSTGSYDVFLSRFDSDGNLNWARTWGGTDGDLGYSVATAASGIVYVSGVFRDTVDFDPGSGIDNHTSTGEETLYLSEFDSNGNFIWARTWGQTNAAYGCSGAADALGNSYVTGNFWGTVDFDPGSGVDTHSSNGALDAFLTKFPPDGSW